MLMKLLKYDMKSMLKTILPLWFVALVVSVLIGVSTGQREEVQISDTFLFVLVTILLVFFITITVVNVVLIIQRFWNGLLKEEGYLMFTLPTSPRSLILSKLISAFIITTISTIVGFACIVIIMSIYTVNVDSPLFQDLAEGIRMLKPYMTSERIGMILMFLLATVIGSIQKIYVVYAAMAIGQLTNRNRFMASVLAFVGLNILISMIATPFVNSRFIVIDDVPSMIPITVLCLALAVVLHMITEYILTKRLNLE